MILCNNNDQTWLSDTLTSAIPLKVVKTLTFQALLSGWLKPSAFRLSPRGPADVNA